MLQFTCEFHLGGTPQPVGGGQPPALQIRNCTLALGSLNFWGDLYAEGLVLETARHHATYTGPRTTREWRITNTYRGRPVGVYRLLHKKTAVQGVTGHIGEAVAIPALAECLGVPENAFRFQRLRAPKVKSPDFRLRTIPSYLESLWLPGQPGRFASFPPDIPLEAKTKLGVDNGYPREAFDQLHKYWEECLVAPGPIAGAWSVRVGYGIIARINLSQNLTTANTIRYYLFAPRPGVTPAQIAGRGVDVAAAYQNKTVLFDG